MSINNPFHNVTAQDVVINLGKIADRWGAFCFYDILSELDLVPPFWELSNYFGKSKDE